MGPPEFGYELEGLLGEVVVEIEMAWPEQQIAVLLRTPDDGSSDQPLGSWLDGWVIFHPDSPPDRVLPSFRSKDHPSPVLASQP